uniref:Angiotensin-converting enzyme n=1 Tax=Stomoxys calcitrans TaxID=35570 RepID=A0A1I8P6Q5_STOCA
MDSKERHGIIVIKILILAFICKLSLAITFYELNAIAFCEQASKRYYSLFDNLSAETYATTNEEDFATLYNRVATVKGISRDILQISREAKEFNKTLIQDADLRRALDRLSYVGGLFVLGDEYFESVLISMNALKSLSTDKDIKPYQAEVDANVQNIAPIAYYPDIQKIYESSSDAKELQYYWMMWREKNAIWAAVNLQNIIDAIRNAAKLMDRTPLDFYYNAYESPEILVQMDQIMLELKPAYLQLHAYIRHELASKYNHEELRDTGPIPDHLFQQVLAQTWKENSVIEEHFSFRDLPSYDRLVEGLSSQKLIFHAQGFYRSLGFADLKEDFTQNRLKEVGAAEASADCRANIFDMTPNVRMQYCPNIDFRNFMQMHSHLGRIHYAVEKHKLPSYFFQAYGLEYAVGEAVTLAASTPKHLQTLGLARDLKYSEETLRNRHIRMAIHTFLNIPLFYVHTKVINEMLQGNVKLDGVNRLYWKLMQEYVGVEPPMDRGESCLDLPYKFYLDLETNHQTLKFVSEILGYQLYEAFCQLTNGQTPLHNCNFYGNSKVGNALRSMMSLGSSKPYHEILNEILPHNPSINAHSLLVYYQPIIDWLKNFNSKNKVHIGWNDTKRKIM